MELKGGHITEDSRLDRVPSATDEHLIKYPLRAEDIEALAKPTPMAIGINWYANFDNPVQDSRRHWWIGRSTNLGRIRGGHCVCLKNRRVADNMNWWDYYDQGSEGRCVQFGVSRMMTLLNRTRYEVRESHPMGRWLYFEAQKSDEWEGGAYPGAEEYYEGTSVNAGLRITRNLGLIKYNGDGPILAEGISVFRWAKNWNDVKAALGYSDVNYVDILNSWGRDYPHLVRMPDEVGDRVLREDGEFGIVTDR